MFVGLVFKLSELPIWNVLLSKGAEKYGEFTPWSRYDFMLLKYGSIDQDEVV
ncbi:putative glycoside hydrolase [Salmonella phage 19]|nr:putative glycoside hydrolase [Salmonella phage 19]